MNKEQLIEFLKHNLEVRVAVIDKFNLTSDGTKAVRVELLIGKEIISTSEADLGV